ncbi:unnamed protein product [Nesidiocoris tenuis]|uniref:Uncharacterized protein n=1 Tax=Nesidiocoris tenuis TaxID=355587 RepID=A0A6H5GUZ7_9HEMI|nr:unnamed protein product [Nesidiocoris tenuis]
MFQPPEMGSEPEGSGCDRWRPYNVDELLAGDVPYPAMLISKSTVNQFSFQKVLYRRRSGEISYLHFVKTAAIAMVPYVTTLNFHDISNVHVQSKWKYCDRPKIENRNGASEKLFLIHIYSESLPEQVKTQFRLNIGREPTLPPWRRAALAEPEPGGAEPGNPSPSINDIPRRPDQHGGSFDQPPGTAQQAIGATISRIYDPRACSSV